MLVVGDPTSRTRGQSGGHALHQSGSAHETETTDRDQLLLTPSSEADFKGEPYPRPGLQVVGTGGNPPWLVVDHFIERIVVTRWPVRLWRVGHIEAAPQADQVTSWYTRAISVEIVEEVPAHTLFGEWGASVIQILELAALLTEDDVDNLARHRSAAAGQAYVDLWNRWQGTESPRGSPVGAALLLIHDRVNQSARRTGRSLFRFDPIDEVDVLDDPAWGAAQSALLEAAVGLGAPQFAEKEERELLTRSWTARPPGPSHNVENPSEP